MRKLKPEQNRPFNWCLQVEGAILKIVYDWEQVLTSTKLVQNQYITPFAVKGAKILKIVHSLSLSVS